MAKDFEIIDHIADVKVKAFGKTKQELFINAVKGMIKILQPEIQNPNVKCQRKIKIKSIDENSLLVDFLSEVLYLIQTNKEIYNEVKFTRFGPSTDSTSSPQACSGQIALEAELFGNKVESFGEDIKAVTYHGLEIEKNKNGYQATILLDI